MFTALIMSRGWWLRGDAAGDGTRSRRQRYDTLLTSSKFWLELNIENHDIETILQVRSCWLVACRTGGLRFILSGRGNLTGTGVSRDTNRAGFVWEV